MAVKDALIAELEHETHSTRRILEKVSLQDPAWRPHPKSMTIGRLATHVAEIPHWISDIMLIDDFDFMVNYHPRKDAADGQLIQVMETNVNEAITNMKNNIDDAFERSWTVRRGEQVMFVLPKKVAIRGWGLNHLYHHRGQLSVYLRLMGIPVPGMYGPSADEQ